MPNTMYTVTSAAMISSPSLEREFLKAAAAPWKLALRLAGSFRLCRTLSMAEIALPKAAPGARLKDIVTTGNCPCRLIERGEVLRSQRVNAFKGTAFAPLELLVRVVTVDGVAPMPAVMAFNGWTRTCDEGVNLTGAVSAFDPAAADPDAAKVVAAGGPDVPVEVLA